MDIRQSAIKMAQVADKMKAQEALVLDLEGLTSMTGFFVICSGTSDRHCKAIAGEIIDELKKDGVRPIGLEGLNNGSWVLIDYGDTVVHVFNNDVRLNYDLEGFWDQAPRVAWEEK